MKNAAPTLTPLLRSNFQGDLLALTLLNPDQEFSLAEIGRRLNVIPATVHREVGRLVDSGLLTDRRVGKTRLVQANTADRLFGPTRALIEVTYGPRVILEAVLQDEDGVEGAYIFGTWAARHDGEPGRAPNDVDVLIVGDVGRRQMSHLASRAEELLNLEVNIERVSPVAWQAGEEPFVATLKSRPLIQLSLRREGE